MYCMFMTGLGVHAIAVWMKSLSCNVAALVVPYFCVIKLNGTEYVTLNE